MKQFAIDVLTNWLNSRKISLALVVALWFFLSPSYNNFIQLTEKVNAHEKKFEKLDIIDNKLNAIMLEIGINKFRIERIENGKRIDLNTNQPKTGE